MDFYAERGDDELYDVQLTSFGRNGQTNPHDIQNQRSQFTDLSVNTNSKINVKIGRNCQIRYKVQDKF